MASAPVVDSFDSVAGSELVTAFVGHRKLSQNSISIVARNDWAAAMSHQTAVRPADRAISVRSGSIYGWQFDELLWPSHPAINPARRAPFVRTQAVSPIDDAALPHNFVEVGRLQLTELRPFGEHQRHVRISACLY